MQRYSRYSMREMINQSRAFWSGGAALQLGAGNNNKCHAEPDGRWADLYPGSSLVKCLDFSDLQQQLLTVCRLADIKNEAD